MMLLQHRFSVLLTTFSFFLHLSTASHAAVPVKIAGKKYGTPKLLVIAYNDYHGANRSLVQAVPSAIALGLNMQSLNWDATIVTDVASEPTVKSAVAKRKIAVLTAEDGPALDKVVTTWIETHFKKEDVRSPFGIIAISGHGEERAGELFLLTPNDTSGTGGLSIREKQVYVSKNWLPILFFVDTCRIDAPVKAEQIAIQMPNVPGPPRSPWHRRVIRRRDIERKEGKSSHA